MGFKGFLLDHNHELDALKLSGSQEFRYSPYSNGIQVIRSKSLYPSGEIFIEKL